MHWKRLAAKAEKRILGLLEDRGESLNSLSPKMAKSRGYLGRHLDKGKEDVFKVSFEASEALGVESTAFLAPFCVGERAEDVLASLPAEGDDRGQATWRKTAAEEEDDELLAAARELGERIPRGAEAFARPWPERRGKDPDLEPVYRRLEELERRRHYEEHEVAALCHRAITGADDEHVMDPASPGGAVLLVGMLGLWSTVQRRSRRLRPARDGLRLSLELARRLGDASLLANQLQRAAYAFRDLGEPAMAVQVLDEASRHYLGDDHPVGVAQVLVDQGVMAGHRDDLRAAERFYRAGFHKLPEKGETVHRSCAAQGVATCRDLQGDVHGALEFLRKAATVAERRDPRLYAALLYTAANLERRRKEYAAAEAKYWTSLELFAKDRDADAVLRASLDLCACLVLSGARERLPRVREVVLEHLPDLKNRETLKFQAELLLLELARGSVTVESLEKIAAKLDE